MTCLGGHAQYINAASTRLQDGEDPRDLARVYSRYGHAIGVRCTGESESNSYGNANKLLRSFAQHATVPVINMGDDMYHPCQALSDLMTVEEYYPHYRHKKFVISWAPAPMPRSLYSIHETILIMTRFGLDVTVCYPEGYDPDPTILEEAKNNSSLQGSNLTLTNDRQAALSGAHFVFPRNWLSLKDLASSPASDLQPSKKETPWTLSKKDLQLTDSSCLIMHVLPAFREWEITSELLDSPQSIVFTQAENRLYAQMALLEMLIGEGNSSALELFPDKVLAKSLIQATNCPVAN